MSCPRCGGTSAAEIAAAMSKLIVEKTVFEGPHCHCDDGDGPMPAHSEPEKKAVRAEVTDPMEMSNPTRLVAKAGSATATDQE